MKANVYDRSIYITEPETIVARSVEEYTVQFEFSEAWDGYATVAVFKTHDGTLKEVITVDGEAVIPWEVLTEPGVLYIGVYGTKTGKFRSTVWSEPQTIYDGAEEGDPAAAPETTPWQQAVEQIAEDVATAQAAAEASQTAATSGPKIVNNTWYVWDSEEEAYVSTGVSATEPGPDGYSPSVEITKTGKRTTITITDKTGPHVATILDGEDGSGSGGNGDMTKAIYDTNNDGTVDSADVATNATKLGNQLPAYYAKAADIPTVPTNVSAFTNDAGYITSAPTKTSDLTNDSGFITSAALPTDVSDLNNDAGYVTQQDIGALMPLDVTMGGTGAATLPDAKANLGITSLENTLGGVKFIRKQAGTNTDVSFTFTGLCTFVIFASGYSAEPQGIIFGSCYSNGVVSTTKLNAGSSTNITVTTESFKLSMRCSSTAINVALMTLAYPTNVT